ATGMTGREPGRRAGMTRMRHPPISAGDRRAAGGLLDRRILLTGALAAGALASSARAEPLTVAPWMTTPGSPFTPYGAPSRFEDKVVRVWANPPNAPGTGAARTPLHRLTGTITPNGLHVVRGMDRGEALDLAR